MKKKQLITIVIMVVLVAALAVGYFFSKKTNEEKKKLEQEEMENEQADVIDIYDMDSEDIVSISITSDKGTIEILNKDDGLWYQKDTDIPINDEDVSYMTETVKNFDAIRVINANADNLAEFGLDNPSLQYTITMKDETVYNIKLGQKLQTQIEGYYALVDETNKVYSVSINYFDPFYVSLEDITAIEDEIYVNTDNVTKFALKTADGLDFAASPVDEDFEGSVYYKWKIDKPYENVLVDTDSLMERISNVPRLTYESCVSYNCDDMSQYGLEKPYATVSIEHFDVAGEDNSDEENFEETADSSDSEAEDEEAVPTPVPESMRNYSTYILNIGDKYTEGDQAWYYVNPDGSANVYTMSATFLDELIGFTSFSVTDSCIYTILVDQLTGYEIEYEGQKIVVERKTEGEKDVYYVNGKQVETEELLRLYSAAYLLTYTGEVDTEKATPEKEPVLTITYHRISGKDDVIKYIPYDGNNFYQVDNNGMNYFVTDKRGIDDLIRRYKEYVETVL